MTAGAMVASADGVGAVVVAGGVVATAAVAVATGVLAPDGPVMVVMMLAVHVTADPPTLPLPLHWLTVTGSAALTREFASTVQ
jgi:hypothetical protein